MTGKKTYIREIHGFYAVMFKLQTGIIMDIIML